MFVGGGDGSDLLRDGQDLYGDVHVLSILPGSPTGDDDAVNVRMAWSQPHIHGGPPPRGALRCVAVSNSHSPPVALPAYAHDGIANEYTLVWLLCVVWRMYVSSLPYALTTPSVLLPCITRRLGRPLPRYGRTPRQDALLWWRCPNLQPPWLAPMAPLSPPSRHRRRRRRRRRRRQRRDDDAGGGC